MCSNTAFLGESGGFLGLPAGSLGGFREFWGNWVEKELRSVGYLDRFFGFIGRTALSTEVCASITDSPLFVSPEDIPAALADLVDGLLEEGVGLVAQDLGPLVDGLLAMGDAEEGGEFVALLLGLVEEIHVEVDGDERLGVVLAVDA